MAEPITKEQVKELFNDYYEEVMDYVNYTLESGTNKKEENFFIEFLAKCFAESNCSLEDAKEYILGDEYTDERDTEILFNRLKENNILPANYDFEKFYWGEELLEDLFSEDYESALDDLSYNLDTTVFENFSKKELRKILKNISL